MKLTTRLNVHLVLRIRFHLPVPFLRILHVRGVKFWYALVVVVVVVDCVFDVVVVVVVVVVVLTTVLVLTFIFVRICHSLGFLSFS
jgi:hypothetical protein